MNWRSRSERVVVGCKAEHQSQDFAPPQQVRDRRAAAAGGAAFRLGITAPDELAFQLRQPPILAWVAINPIKQDEIEQAQAARDRESPSPAVSNQEEAEEGLADGRAELRRGVEACRGQAALARGKPVADSLRIRRKRRCFADTEQQSCGKKARESRCHRRAEGSATPQKRADSSDCLYAKAIEQFARREL